MDLSSIVWRGPFGRPIIHMDLSAARFRYPTSLVGSLIILPFVLNCLCYKNSLFRICLCRVSLFLIFSFVNAYLSSYVFHMRSRRVMSQSSLFRCDSCSELSCVRLPSSRFVIAVKFLLLLRCVYFQIRCCSFDFPFPMLICHGCSLPVLRCVLFWCLMSDLLFIGLILQMFPFECCNLSGCIVSYSHCFLQHV